MSTNTFKNIPNKGGTTSVIFSSPLVPITASGWTYPGINGDATLGSDKASKELDIPLPGLSAGDTINSFYILGSGYNDDVPAEFDMTCVLTRVNIDNNGNTAQTDVATMTPLSITDTFTTFGLNSSNTFTTVGVVVDAGDTFRLRITGTTISISLVSIFSAIVSVTRA